MATQKSVNLYQIFNRTTKKTFHAGDAKVDMFCVYLCKECDPVNGDFLYLNEVHWQNLVGRPDFVVAPIGGVSCRYDIKKVLAELDKDGYSCFVSKSYSQE